MKLLLVIFLLFILIVDASAQLEPIDTDGDALRNLSSIEHILFLSLHPDYWGYSYELDNNIDLSETKSWNNNLGFSPIGNEEQAFFGVFDGHNFSLTNLTINRPDADNLGFFGIVSANADISNLKFTDADINGNSSVGIIVGKNFGILDNTYVKGKITANGSYVGGITGQNSGSLMYCRTNININGSDAYYGGVAGENFGTISKSRSIGEIHSAYIIGGLVGDNSGVISDCYSRVNIYAEDNYIGGLAGSNWDMATIVNSYSTGLVKGAGYYQGGLVGFKHNSATDIGCFWDTESSDIYESVGGEGKTTSEMKDISTYLTENWDFTDVWSISSSINDGYPSLKSKPTSAKDDETLTNPIVSFLPSYMNEAISIDILAQYNSYFSLSVYDCRGSLVVKKDGLYLTKGTNHITQNLNGLTTGV